MDSLDAEQDQDLFSSLRVSAQLQNHGRQQLSRLWASMIACRSGRPRPWGRLRCRRGSSWFLYTHKNSKIPVAANSQDQLRDTIWPEIAKWQRTSSQMGQCHDRCAG